MDRSPPASRRAWRSHAGSPGHRSPPPGLTRPPRGSRGALARRPGRGRGRDLAGVGEPLEVGQLVSTAGCSRSHSSASVPGAIQQPGVDPGAAKPGVDLLGRAAGSRSPRRGGSPTASARARRRPAAAAARGRRRSPAGTGRRPTSGRRPPAARLRRRRSPSGGSRSTAARAPARALAAVEPVLRGRYPRWRDGRRRAPRRSGPGPSARRSTRLWRSGMIRHRCANASSIRSSSARSAVIVFGTRSHSISRTYLPVGRDDQPIRLDQRDRQQRSRATRPASRQRPFDRLLLVLAALVAGEIGGGVEHQPAPLRRALTARAASARGDSG